MRGRLCLFGAGMLLLAGCAKEAPATHTAVPVPPVVQLPAAAAGGVCRLLDFDVIEEVTGVRFDVSAASQHRSSRSCVLRSETTERPDLVLTATETKADPEVFVEELVPSGGRQVKGLGKAAYQLILAPGRGHGAGVELGWLTGDGEVINLRYTFAAGSDREAAKAFAGKLTALAKKLRTDKG